MTLIVSILIPDGIVLATDSRQAMLSINGQLRVNSDSAEKIIPIFPNKAVLTAGQANLYKKVDESSTPVDLLIKELSNQLRKLSVENIAKKICSHLSKTITLQENIISKKCEEIVLFVAGYDRDASVGKLFKCVLPSSIIVLERTTTDAGAVWFGQSHFVERLLHGYDQRLLYFLDNKHRSSDMADSLSKCHILTHFQTMKLNDAIDYAYLLIYVTIEMQRLSDGIMGNPGQFPDCGGPVRIATITGLHGFKWVI